MPTLHINLLGKIELKYEERQLEHKLSNKGIALLSLLMLSMDKHISREKIISYLWADSDEEAARYNLRYNLWNIKKIIPTDANDQEFILSNKDYCVINSKYDFTSDMLELSKFKPGKKENSLEELNKFKELFRGDFLEGIYIKNSDDFNEKIIFERIIYQNKYVEVLKEIADKYETYNNYKDQIQILTELLSIEPYNEELAYKQMLAYINWGQRCIAIQYYKKFEAVLRSNLNTSPSRDLKDLYRALMEQPEDISHSAVQKRIIRKEKIEIDIQCIENIEYFCMAEIIKKILLKGDKKYIFGLNRYYLEDLNFIQIEVGIGFDKFFGDKCTLHESLPTVRVINAFLKFLLYLSEIYQFQIKVLNPEEMDQTSLHTIKYIIQLQQEDLHFII